MGVLGIFMSEADAPEGIKDFSGSFHDAAICDFAWEVTPTTSAAISQYSFVHDVAAGNVTWYHFALQYGSNSDSNDDGALNEFYDDNGLLIGYIDVENGLLRLAATTSAGTDFSTTFAIPLAALKRYDVKIDITTTMSIEIYEDGGGSPLKTASVALGTSSKPAMFSVTQFDNFRKVYTSELYAADYDTRNTRPVKQKVNATGNYSEWIGGFAELSDGDVATAASGAAGGDKLTMNLTTYPGPSSPTGIKEVVVKAIVAKGSSGPANVRPMCRISATDYFESNLDPIEGAPLSVYGTFALNPDTAAAWATADLDTTEFGIEAVT